MRTRTYTHTQQKHAHIHTHIDVHIHTTGSHDSCIKLWDLTAGRAYTTLTHHKKSVRALAMHPSKFILYLSISLLIHAQSKRNYMHIGKICINFGTRIRCIILHAYKQILMVVLLLFCHRINFSEFLYHRFYCM